MPNISTGLLLLTVIFILLPSNVQAFGAGDIPDFAYLNDKAFRHGDIENILEQVLKNAARAAGGGGLLGFAKQAFRNASGGSKFDKGDIKKVYFGNWLRDYSQAMDIAGLSKLTAETLVLVVSVLGFMTFGFATEEFEVTADRLEVYLPVEHIDNPKGYAEKEGDARNFHPKLRPPVDPRELEIDPRNGMKNYMATEDQGWDSSTAHIRRTFRACIEHGRRAGGREGSDLWEAYRLLGTGLHTMEDLLAHSNWCEITLRKMGYSEVFCHVGENTDIDTPSGRAPPLVTGTFGSADFLHSLLGEATDHLSQASVTSLSQKMSDASNTSDAPGNIENLRKIFSKLPIGGSDEKINQAEELQQESKAYNFNPDDIAPPAVQKQLLEMLVWRDGVYRWIIEKIEMIPGLSSLIDELTNALNAYVYTVIAPWLTPILTQATSVLGEGSKAVIDTDDQYEVFNNPDSSDPSHSLLSKDHFGLILNEPAGKVAQTVVVYSTEIIVKAWANDSDPDRAIDQILEAFHHPYFANEQYSIQHKMFEEMERWIGSLGPDEASQTIQALTKESVRNGKNKRLMDETEGQVEAGYGTLYTSQQPVQIPGYPQGNEDTNYGGEQRFESQYEQQSQNDYNSYNQADRYNSGTNTQQYPEDGYSPEAYRQNDEFDSGRGQQYSVYDDRQQFRGHNQNQSEQNSYGSGQESEYGQPTGGSYGYGRGQQDLDEYRQQFDRHESSGYEEVRDTRRPGYRQPEDPYDSHRRGQQPYDSEPITYRSDDAYGTTQYQSDSDRAEQGPLSYQHRHNNIGRDEYTHQGDEYAPRNDAYQQSYEERYQYDAGDIKNRPYNEGFGHSRREDSRQEEYGRGYEEREDSHRHTTHGGHHKSHNSDRGYEGRYGGQEDETFGAERLNIDDEYTDRNRYEY
ncbi:Het-C-domain-containing protein [Lentinula detonsa]|uniref:Het-C-domain-containing protein n=1 Tax=Lentinula detonsa TaxID=2804962 RepID=A0A9W8U3I4_9AGAR|nr:Het-C-domain-containing protein [Lentinula detonsa]